MTEEPVVAERGDDNDQAVEPKGSGPATWVMWLGLAAITIVGLYYRFHLLDLKPMHHDEGVNGWFILRILDEYKYRYNPKNYHGPLLYFLNTIAVIIGGRTVTAIRFMPALFGALAIPAMALFRRYIGVAGVLVAAAFVAVAPIEVYFSRTAIHEIYNFTFNMTLVGGMAAYLLERRRRHLVLASLSLVCLFATKETTIITVFAVGAAAAVAILAGKTPLPSPPDVKLEGKLKEKIRAGWRWSVGIVKADPRSFRVAAIVFVVVWALLFSSFFTNLRGLGAFFEAFFRWGQTGVEGRGHQKPAYYFITHLLYPYYRPLLWFGLPGLIWGTIRRERLAIFTLVWFVAALAVYSSVHYKTPWCVISFSNPLFIGVGVFTGLAVRAVRTARPAARVASATGLLVLLLLLVPYSVPMPEWYHNLIEPARHAGTDLKGRLRQVPGRVARALLPITDSWTINFEEYDVKGHPFIYVQNLREYLYLINDLHGLIETAQLDGDETQPHILMIDAKNPMRWYLQKTGTQEWRKKFTDKVKEMIPDKVDIACVSKKYHKEAAKLFDKKIYIKRRYHERPGRIIDVYIKRDLWKAYVKAAAEGLALKPSPPFQFRSFSARRSAEMKDPWSRRPRN